MSLNVRIVFGADDAFAVSEDGTVFPVGLEYALALLHGGSDAEAQTLPMGSKTSSGSPTTGLIGSGQFEQRALV